MTAPPRRFLLALDTCTPVTVVAVVDRDTGAVWGRTFADRPNQASERLSTLVTACLEAAHASDQAVEAVCVANGPGTFTGTRVGVAFAMGLALGWSVPTVPVDPLEVLARAAGTKGRVLGLLDARKGEVYAAGYDLDETGAAVRIEPAVRTTLDALPDGAVWDAVVGPGADAHAGRLRGANHLPGVRATPEALAAAARANLAAGRAVAPDHLEAIYLRKSYAELGMNAPKRPVYRSPLLDPSD